MLQDNRFERILYYPDRKGLGLRQVQALLAEQDASVLAVGALEGKSVAVQGLGALEFVLPDNLASSITGLTGWVLMLVVGWMLSRVLPWAPAPGATGVSPSAGATAS